jgi:hypothetical protein
MRSIAADFLTRCFAPDETIALLLRRENPISTLQRVVPLARISHDRALNLSEGIWKKAWKGRFFMA